VRACKDRGFVNCFLVVPDEVGWGVGAKCRDSLWQAVRTIAHATTDDLLATWFVWFIVLIRRRILTMSLRALLMAKDIPSGSQAMLLDAVELLFPHPSSLRRLRRS